MLILAFDTSGFAGSVALLDGPRLLHEVALEPNRGSAQTLAPAIVETLTTAGVDASQIKLVATTTGPGSFTGLRVGITTAKTFAYAVGAEVIGVSTLEAIAHGAPAELLSGHQREIDAVLDAQRRELFVGRFLCAESHSADVPVCQSSGADIPVCQSSGADVPVCQSSGADIPVCQRDDLPVLTRIEPDKIIAADEWLASLAAGTIVTGAAVTKLQQLLPSSVVAVPESFRQPRAGIVGRLAWRDYHCGRRDDLWQLAPVYLRPSYAEEKAATGGRGAPSNRDQRSRL